ncbi:MAG: DUF115 domain-containing protein [Nitrospinota bacterium]|nr:DUF115 domain-containing protein [Nitrospinota bacterium]
MNFLNKNLEIIDKRHSRVSAPLRNLPAPPKPEKTKHGEVTVAINGLLLAGKVDPKREGDKFANSLSLDGKDNLLVYGFGLGYHLESVVSTRPELKRIVAIEASRDILSAALNHRDLSTLLSDSRFELVTAESEQELTKSIIEAIKDGGENWEVAIHLPSFRCIPEGFDRVKDIFDSLLGEKRFKARFSGVERENIKANLEAIASSPGASSIFGALKGYPAILVGAGPSLDRNLSFLDKVQNSSFILAVDTAAEALRENGIGYDAVISVDPQVISFSHFAGARGGAPLFFSPTTHPQVVERFKNSRMLLLKKGHTIFQPAETLLEERGVVDAGGSVSCFALDLLAKSGADPIGFVGQDFGFPKGAPYNRSTFSDMDSTNPGSMMDGSCYDSITLQHDRLETEFYSGEKGFTHPHLNGYRKTFEEIIARYPERSFISINSSGAVIAGCRNIVSWGETVKLFKGAGKPKPPLNVPPEKENRALMKKLEQLLFA